MQLKFLGNKCSKPESIFGFLIKFMLSHNHAFQAACSLCPFGYCYRYFIGLYAAIQVIWSMKELHKHFKERPGDDEEVLFHIRYLDLPITNHNYCIIRHTLCLSANSDLLLRTLTSESVEELISFTFISLIQIIYSWSCYCIEFKTLESGQKVVQSVMNTLPVLNLCFLLCFIFDNYKNCQNF